MAIGNAPVMGWQHGRSDTKEGKKYWYGIRRPLPVQALIIIKSQAWEEKGSKTRKEGVAPTARGVSFSYPMLDAKKNCRQDITAVYVQIYKRTLVDGDREKLKTAPHPQPSGKAS